MCFSLAELNQRHERAPAPEAPTHTKRGELTGRRIDREKRLVQGIVTTSDVGIDGLIVPATALDLTYFWEKTNANGSKRAGQRAVYYGHDYSQPPVGMCVRLAIEGESMYCSTFITRTGFGDDLMTLMEEGCVNGISSGFRTRDWSPPTPEERKRWGVGEEEEAMVVRDALMLEYSIVAMPALPEAQIERMVTRGAIRRQSAVLIGLPETPTRRFYPTHGAAKVERVTLDDEPVRITL